MGINSLPYELKYKIAEFLDTKSLISLIVAGLRELDNNFIWKQKCNKEYYFYSYRIKNWKEKYKKLYLRKCIHCYKNTKLYNEFYKVKVCRNCEIDNTRYHTISHTKAKIEYFLTENELKTFNFIYRINPFNYTKKIKLYLKHDIVKSIINSEGKYIQSIQKRIDIRRIYYMKKVYKLYIFLSTLVGVYNVSTSNITSILSNVNVYSKGLFKKFMRYNNRSIIPVINKALELDFIFTYTNTLIYNTYDDFEHLLYEYLLSNVVTILPSNINEYIDSCMNKFNKTYRDCIIRKKEILQLYNELKNRISITNILKISTIYRYIQFGTIYELPNTKSQVKTHILLHNFLYVYTDIQTIIFQHNLLGKIVDKYSLYIRLLNKWYINNPTLRFILPKELYPLIVY